MEQQDESMIKIKFEKIIRIFDQNSLKLNKLDSSKKTTTKIKYLNINKHKSLKFH
jgi:hypothetical protein